MNGPSENQFLATLGLSTLVTFGGLYLANRAPGRGTGPPRVPLGPNVTTRSVGLVLLVLLGGCGVVLAVAAAIHRVAGDAMLWWVATALVPVSLTPTVVAAKRLVAADARGDLALDGDALVLTWNGDATRWPLPECTASLRLTPSGVPGSDLALLVVIEGPPGVLPFVVPLMGLGAGRVMSDLGVPEGLYDPPGGAAFPVQVGVAAARPLLDGVLARVGTIDRGGSDPG